jgi:putative intracellular protease/amidase
MSKIAVPLADDFEDTEFSVPLDRLLSEDHEVGGHSPDHLRTNRAVVSFVRRFCESGRPVAAICHGPQLLIEADAVR